MLTKNNWQEAFDLLHDYAVVDYLFYGDICSYHFLSFEGVKELVKKKYLYLSERQNYSPAVRDWIKFIEENCLQDKVYFHGYIVDKIRSDRRITIEGIQSKEDVEFSESELKCIADFCHSADTFRMQPLYVWWD